MKLLIIFNHPAPYKIDFFNELSKYHDVHVLFEKKSNKDRNKLFYKGKEIKFSYEFLNGISLGNENHIFGNLPLYFKKHASKYDLIIMNGYHTFTEMAGIDYLKKHNIKYAFYINGGIIKTKESKFKKNLKTHYIKGADLYFSPDLNSNKYLEYYGADSSKIRIYPYSTIFENEIIPKPLTQEEKNILRDKYDVKGEKVFVSVGQFIKRKNYLTLLNLWKNVPSTYSLILIGGGELKEEYQKFIKENKLNNVTLIDFKPKNIIYEYLKLSDAFVFLSLEDIYGHVINEAMSQGIPVISSNRVNAATNLIKDGYNGYQIDLNNVDKFIEYVKTINVYDLANNAIETAKKNTIELMTKTHNEILKEYEK